MTDGIAVIDLESPKAIGEVLEAFKYLQNHWTENDLKVELLGDSAPGDLDPGQLASDYYDQFQSHPLVFFKNLDLAYRKRFLLKMKEALSIIRKEKWSG